MTENNENSRNQASNENDAILDFSNVKGLEKNKERSKGKKIDSKRSQNYNDTTTKYTTNDYNEFILLNECIYPILNKINYDILKFDLFVIDYYKIPQKIVNMIYKFLDNEISAISDNITSESKSINSGIEAGKEKEKENIEDSMSEKDEIIQPEQKKENTDQVIYMKDFVLFDESKIMIKDKNENEIDIFRKKKN